MSVEQRLARAKNELRASESAVRRASAERRDWLLTRPLRERIRFLDDPALTLNDRRLVQRSLIEALPDETTRIHWFGRSLPHGACWAAVTFLVAVYLFFYAAGPTRDAGQRAYFVGDTVVEWNYPSGRIVRVIHPANTATEWTTTRGDYALIRIWTGEGAYAVAWVRTTSLYRIP